MATSKNALIEELQAIRSAKLRILKTGQRVQVPGAFDSEAVSYKALCKRESEIKQKLLRSSGAPRRVRPRYGDYSGTRDWEDS